MRAYCQDCERRRKFVIAKRADIRKTDVSEAQLWGALVRTVGFIGCDHKADLVLGPAYENGDRVMV